MAPPSWMPDQIDYYAAQGNATRIFLRREFSEKLKSWHIIKAGATQRNLLCDHRWIFETVTLSPCGVSANAYRGSAG